MTAPKSPTSSKRLSCHRCGSADLVLRETRHEHAEFDSGLFISEQGHIQACGSGHFTPGEIQSSLTRIECTACGHEWRPRRVFDGALEGGQR